MKSLIVTSHPERASFNHAMAEVIAEALVSIGHRVQTVDLFAEDFDPVVRASQFSDRADPGRFDIMAEQSAQALRGDLPEDVLIHHQRLLSADHLILQFPLWWWSLPAQLKGWVDRVLSAGFAYGGASLAGRTAMLSVTAETKAERFLAQGGDNPLHHIERGILKFCGYRVLPAFVIANVYDLGTVGRKARLAALRAHVIANFSIGEAQSAAC